MDVSQILTGRRERRRAAEERADQRVTRFLDVKRVVFVDYLRAVRTHEELLTNKLLGAWDEEKDGPALLAAHNMLKTVEPEIQIIAPEFDSLLSEYTQLRIKLHLWPQKPNLEEDFGFIPL